MIEKILVGLVVGILQYLMARKDLRDSAKAEVYREMYERAQKAYDWEIAVGPDGGGDLRVRDGASPIELSGGRTNTDRTTPGA